MLSVLQNCPGTKIEMMEVLLVLMLNALKGMQSWITRTSTDFNNVIRSYLPANVPSRRRSGLDHIFYYGEGTNTLHVQFLRRTCHCGCVM